MANGKIERWHRILKTALKAHMTEDWVAKLPIVLLGFRSYIIPEYATTSVAITYGEPIRLPADLLNNTEFGPSDLPSLLVKLNEHIQNIRPVQTKHHSDKKFSCILNLVKNLVSHLCSS